MAKKEHEQKTLKEKTSDVKYTYDIHLRITDEERQTVQKKADELGCNLSQAARMILFKKMSSSLSNLSEKDEKRSQILAMQSTRTEFKKISTSYMAFVDAYVKSVDLKNRMGDPAVSTASTIRLVGSLEDYTLELQKSLNLVLHEMGLKEEHPLARSRELKSLDEANDELTLINYTYMERMEIIGKLTEDASVYKSKSGLERLRLKVVCESVGRGGVKVTRDWVIFYGKTDAVNLLKKDKTVYVAGDFSVGDNDEFILFADNVKFAE